MPSPQSAPSVTALERRVEDNRAEEIRRFASELKALFDAASKRDFQLAIDRSCSAYGLDPKLVAGTFGVSPGTISRWRNGHSMPPKYARAGIVERLGDLLLVQLDDA